MKYNFYSPTKVFFGVDCIKQNSSELKKLGDSCLIITGRTSAIKSGAQKQVSEILKALQISFEVFSEFAANPLLSTAKKAGEQAKGKDFIIAIGGGSVIDGAKAAAVYAKCDMAIDDIYTTDFSAGALPIVTIGTTAGTGSEITPASVVTSDTTGIKKSFVNECVFNTLVFADPTFTASMPHGIALSTALDAFSHCIESYYANTATEMTKVFALEGIRNIYPILCEQSDYSSLTLPQREKLLFGSIMAGYAIAGSGTCFPHPMGYILTENFGLPHGMATATFLPEFILQSVKNGGDTTILSFDYRDIIKTLTGLISHDIVLPENFFDNFKDRLNATSNFKRTPGVFTFAEAKQIVDRIFY